MPYSILIQVEISQRNAGMAQSVERRIGSAEVTGPIPVSSFFINRMQKINRPQIGLFFCAFLEKKFIVRKVKFSINV